MIETRDDRRSAGLDAALRDHLDEVLDGMSDAIRDAMVLRYAAGLSEPDVARELDATAGSVRRRLGRGLASIRRRLARLGYPMSAVCLEAALARLPIETPSEGFAARTLELCTGAAAMTDEQTRVLQAVESTLVSSQEGRRYGVGGLWTRFLAFVGSIPAATRRSRPETGSFADPERGDRSGGTP